MIAFIYSVQNLVNFATMPAAILLPPIGVVLLDEIINICYNITDGKAIVFHAVVKEVYKMYENLTASQFLSLMDTEQICEIMLGSFKVCDVTRIGVCCETLLERKKTRPILKVINEFGVLNLSIASTTVLVRCLEPISEPNYMDLFKQALLFAIRKLSVRERKSFDFRKDFVLPIRFLAVSTSKAASRADFELTYRQADGLGFTLDADGIDIGYYLMSCYSYDSYDARIPRDFTETAKVLSEITGE